MHPEVVSDKPGSCPKCGMALEPVMISAGDDENPELKDMSRRFWVSVVLTAPLVVFAMTRHIASLHWYSPDLLRWAPWIELALATPVVLWGGKPFSHTGRHYNIECRGLRPLPVQQPHPPVWVAAQADPPAREAPRAGLSSDTGHGRGRRRGPPRSGP